MAVPAVQDVDPRHLDSAGAVSLDTLDDVTLVVAQERHGAIQEIGQHQAMTRRSVIAI